MNDNYKRYRILENNMVVDSLWADVQEECVDEYERGGHDPDYDPITPADQEEIAEVLDEDEDDDILPF